jgi:hypothetical protein
MVALPTVASDNNAWGTELNAWALVQHLTDGTHVDDILRYGTITRGTIYVPKTATVAQINTWALALSTAGGGTLIFEPATYKFATPIIGYSLVTYDFNGARVEPTAAADIWQTLNFDTYTTTATTVLTGAPYRITIKNGLLYQPSGLGRNCVSLYGYACRIEDMTLFSQSVGSALWTEYGSTTETFQSGSGTGSTVYGDARLHVQGLTIIDNPSTSAVNTAPAANDYSFPISGIASQTVTCTRSHFLTVGQTVTIGGSNFTVSSLTSNLVFVVTSGAPSGATGTYHVSAAWTHLGPHDSLANSVILAATGHVAGRRGILLGTNGNASCTGQGFTNTHVYDNFDVTIDVAAGNVLMDDSCQFEGAYKCVMMIRNNGQTTVHGDIYGGQGGVVLLFVGSSVNQLDIRSKLFSAGSNIAAPSGFANTYFENYAASNSIIDISIQHGYATAFTLGTGSAPAFSQVFMILSNFGAGAVTAGWFGGQVDATHWMYLATPKGDSTAAQVLTTGGTIATTLPSQRVAPAGAVTGVILTAGSYGDDRVTVINESAFSITMAAAATSNVATGTSDVIAANTAAWYAWSSGTNWWYRV